MEVTKTFSIREALKFGFNTCIDNFWFFVKYSLLYVAALVILYVIAFFSFKYLEAAGHIIRATIGVPFLVALPLIFARMIFSFAINNLFVIQMLHYGLQAYDHKPLIWHLFPETKIFLKSIIAYFIIGFGVIVGLIFLIIPGLYVAVVFSFVSFPLIDHKTTSITTDRHMAAKISHGVRWKIALFTLVSLLLAITVILIPVVLLARVFVYRKLYQQTFPHGVESTVAS